ncbi:MAG: DnaJ like chaperone protein [Patiriisocius sp.]|jgi:DnaJ like chaperone protein
MSIGKFIGGAIGWAAGGPIGAFMGMMLGGLFDSFTLDEGAKQIGGSGSRRGARPNARTRFTSRDDFNISLLILSAAVMKADGAPLKSELDYVKKYLIGQFGKAKATEYVKMLREILQKNLELRSICIQIQTNMQHPLRLQLIHYLFGIANANNHIHSRELDVIRRIATYLRISRVDFESIKNMFVKNKESSYKILEIEKSVTNDEVKKAYRKMARKYHPDKVTHLGEEHQNAAKEKFQKIQAAYEEVKKERRMK